MQPLQTHRPRLLIGIAAGAVALLLLFLGLMSARSGTLHWNDFPFVSSGEAVDPNSLFAEGRELHCTGLEKMSPTAALATLEEKGFTVTIVHDLARTSRNVRSVPEGAVLQDVGAAPGSDRAFMFVMTPEHPRSAEGFIADLPPQNC